MSVKICKAITDSKRQELTKHGSLFFPVAAYDDDLTLNSVEWHWHDEFEIDFVVAGSGVIEVNSQKFELKEGEGIFVNSGVLHAAHKTEKSFRVHSMVFHADLIAGNDLSVFREKYILPLLRSAKFFVIDNDSELKKIFSKAWRVFEKEKFGYEFEIRELLSRILLMILKNAPVESKTSPAEERSIKRIKKMLTFIQENFSQAINVSHIAASAYISQSECLRCFHKILGTTPVKYLKNYRLRKAESMLTLTDESIADVASACGFQDISYFTKVFREKNKMTPSEYRSV